MEISLFYIIVSTSMNVITCISVLGSYIVNTCIYSYNFEQALNSSSPLGKKKHYTLAELTVLIFSEKCSLTHQKYFDSASLNTNVYMHFIQIQFSNTFSGIIFVLYCCISLSLFLIYYSFGLITYFSITFQRVCKQ